MGIKMTILPWIVFGGGLTGLGGGLLLQWWMNAYDWPWIVSGKPFWSACPPTSRSPSRSRCWPRCSRPSSACGGSTGCRSVWHPFFRSDRFARVTDDRFFLGIEAADKVFERGKAQALLEESGALGVETCYVSQDPERWSVPRPVMGFVIVTTIAALVPFALIAKARAVNSDEPRFHIWSDMDFQPKVKAQNASTIFADGRASRGPSPAPWPAASSAGTTTSTAACRMARGRARSRPASRSTGAPWSAVASDSASTAALPRRRRRRRRHGAPARR